MMKLNIYFLILHTMSVLLQNSINNGKYETQRSLSTAGRPEEESNVWQQIQHLAKTKRTQELNADPPKRQGRKPSAGHGRRGGPRPNSGRKKSVPKVSYWIDESFRFHGTV